jgi:apolipoprotein N-acyltransferase
VRGYEGVTPYVRRGNYAALLLIALMLIAAWRMASSEVLPKSL